MTAVLVVLLCVVFLGIDLVVRAVSARMARTRQRREREAALATSLDLSFADEARSLKRVEVPNPKAHILAVDDEAVVLDSFRKILVLAGFSVDTVERGDEALTLVRARDYDFVFTDLKMPEMDGVEVVKGVKHLRPDIDVAVITGFGTIETAVETMAHGAVDYVQKPFTEDELVAFANRLLIRREARLEQQRLPSVRVVTPELAETVAAREYCVPGGAFVAPGHAWAAIDHTGRIGVGIDDFARKALGAVERVDLPAPGTEVARGDVLFVLRRGDERAPFRSPVSGRVLQVNGGLQRDARVLAESPYDRGWVCFLEPGSLAEDLAGLKIGNAVIPWFQSEVVRLRRESAGGTLSWQELETKFFGPGAAERKAAQAVAVAS